MVEALLSLPLMDKRTVSLLSCLSDSQLRRSLSGETRSWTLKRETSSSLELEMEIRFRGHLDDERRHDHQRLA